MSALHPGAGLKQSEYPYIPTLALIGDVPSLPQMLGTHSESVTMFPCGAVWGAEWDSPTAFSTYLQLPPHCGEIAAH